MVKAFLPHTPQKAFADSIRSWRMIWRFESLNATRCRYPGEARPRFAIIISIEIPGSLPVGCGFSKVLRYPGIDGRSCNSRVDHTPRCEFNNDERGERSKEEICHLQEVACPDLYFVIAQEIRPFLPPWLV